MSRKIQYFVIGVFVQIMMFVFTLNSYFTAGESLYREMCFYVMFLLTGVLCFFATNNLSLRQLTAFSIYLSISFSFFNLILALASDITSYSPQKVNGWNTFFDIEFKNMFTSGGVFYLILSSIAAFILNVSAISLILLLKRAYCYFKSKI